MSAQTRQQVEGDVVKNFSALAFDAVKFVTQDKRDKLQVNQMLKALQLFKENRLGEVFAKDTAEMQAVRRRRRLALWAKIQRDDREGRISNGEDPCNWVVHIFGFSQRVGAYLFLGKIPKFRQLLQMDERDLNQSEDAQSMVREIRDKITPHGLYFGMSVAEINEAFGPPPK
ncbi:MAG: hypothetical protein MRY49_00130 [Candidatus Pacebacteria bacterium]|nr:hypothetical protein [Candidatus Paceibacterota bacterium]